jgi:hypothetical protein
LQIIKAVIDAGASIKVLDRSYARFHGDDCLEDQAAF